MASRSVNRVTLLGHLGKPAETKFTPGGMAKTTFSVATSHRYKKGDEWVEETDWTNVVLWRQEKLSEYLIKGTQVYVEGRLSNRSYEVDGVKRYVTEVVADNLILVGGGGGHREDTESAAPTRGRRPAPAASVPIDDDDVAF